MEQWLIDKVIAAKSPKVICGASTENIFCLKLSDEDATMYELSQEDADLLFRTMFFRGRINC